MKNLKFLIMLVEFGIISWASWRIVGSQVAEPFLKGILVGLGSIFAMTFVWYHQQKKS